MIKEVLGNNITRALDLVEGKAFSSCKEFFYDCFSSPCWFWMHGRLMCLRVNRSEFLF